MQYLGGFYLHMGHYTIALTWLSEVMLYRIGSLGNSDAKTLDTVIRFYITVYVNQEENNMDLLHSTIVYINSCIMKDNAYLQEMEDNG